MQPVLALHRRAGAGAQRSGTAIALLYATVAGAAPQISIGVISPKMGASSATGEAHEASIEFALGKRRQVALPDGQKVELRVVTRDDRGDPKIAAEVARDLVENENVVAILGPVNSRCTRAVLDATLDVPIISALSTAQSLAGPKRDHWFFRATVSDQERMRQFVKLLKKYDELLAPPFLVLYEDEEYGRGLRDSLGKVFDLGSATVRSWTEVASEPAGADASLNHDSLLRPEFIAGLPSPPRSIFVLGSNGEGVVLARQLDAALPPAFGKRLFFFVGSDDRLRVQAPENSLTIGEPTVLEEDTLDSLRDEFHRVSGQKPEALLVTAYEAAYYLVPLALEAALKGVHGVPAVPVLRTQLRDALEAGQFESLEGWRSINFDGGELRQAPVVAVYRAQRELELVEIPDPPPYVDIQVPRQAGFLVGPVMVRLKGHSVEKAHVTISRVDGDNVRPVSEEDVELDDDGEGTLGFYPWWPGRFRFDTDVRFAPPRPETEVWWSGYYLLSFLGALIGTFLFVSVTRERGGRVSPRRIVEGLVCALLLTALSFYRSVLPILSTLPLLGDSPGSSAFMTGLVGGWFGPSVVVIILRYFKIDVGDDREEAGESRSHPPGPPPAEAAAH
ncbi:MAG TPA: ABC transporter substrate-binding protein [Candidatus Eisenbacteria bacterium]|nr:ABC transporter substrate-binding protein [Candidatus Eisenbacteria bacterium]